MQRGLACVILTALMMMPSGLYSGWASAGDPVAGKAKTRACIVCHTVDGRSEQPDSPNLSGQVELYLAEQMRAYRSGTRKHKVMSIVAKDMSDADINDLAAWYASVKISVTPPN